MTADTLNTPAYAELERATLELHEMIRTGQGDGPEADDLRAWMSGPWHLLTEEQREFNGALSGDLYMLNPAEGEIYDPVPDDERSPQRLGLAIQAAWDRHDWAGLLALLRKGPAFFPPEYVAFLRAHAYGTLGRLTVALAFIRFARQLDPADVDNQVVEFLLAARAGLPETASALAWHHVDGGTPARLVVAAAGHLFRDTRGQQSDVARPTWRRLADALGRVTASDELRADDDADEVVPYAHLLLGGCLDGLGDATAARAAYDVVLATRPRTPGRVAFQVTLGDYVRQRFDAVTSAASHAADTTRFDLASDFHPRLAA